MSTDEDIKASLPWRMDSVERVQADHSRAIAALNVGQAEHAIQLSDTRIDVAEIKAGQAGVTKALYTAAIGLTGSSIIFAITVATGLVGN